MFFLFFLKIASILLAITGFTFLIPVSVALYCKEFTLLPEFIIPMIISFILVLAINLPTKKLKYTMNTRQTFFVVAMIWIIVSLMGSIPLYFSGYFGSYINAFFESVSGFTTTGASILSNVDNLPRSINVWRCLTNWLGGMGIVTLTVALLPLLGVGGFQLIKAETTGPQKGKVTARITTTAKVLWIIYASLTLIETIALKIAGMDFIDALSHSFSTLGSGGFSTHTASIASYKSPAIDVIVTIFMFMSGVNFSIYYYLIIRNFREIKDNSEFKAYIGIVLFFVIAVSFSLTGTYGSFGKSLQYSGFQVISLISTTGFTTAAFTQWPPVTQLLLFLLYFIGGSSGSTSGGIKVIRWIILGKQLNNETKKMLHPHGVFSIRLNNKVCSKDIVFNVASFMLLYFILVSVTAFAGCLGNLDIYTSVTTALSMVGNVGQSFSLSGIPLNYGLLPSFVKLFYCFAMLAGRLELYTMIIFFFPSYWKRFLTR